MIKPLILSILLLISINFREHKPKLPEYILFTLSSATETHRTRPLYISTHKLNIPLDSFRYEILKRELKQLGTPITKKIYEAYRNTQYAFVITDKKTYKALLDFIYTHEELYKKGPINYNDYYTIVDIDVDNKTFILLDDGISVFFNKISQYLKLGNYDKNVINGLDEI